MNAARQAKDVLSDVAAEFFGCSKDVIAFRDSSIFNTDEPDQLLSYPELMLEMGKEGKLAIGAGSYNPKTTFLDPENMAGIPYEVYSYATTVAEVTVDTETGEVDVLSVVSAHDVGQPVNLAGVEGQIEGGVAMGEGFALMEEGIVNEGQLMNKTFSKIPYPDLSGYAGNQVHCCQQRG